MRYFVLQLTIFYQTVKTMAAYHSLCFLQTNGRQHGEISTNRIQQTSPCFLLCFLLQKTTLQTRMSTSSCLQKTTTTVHQDSVMSPSSPASKTPCKMLSPKKTKGNAAYILFSAHTEAHTHSVHTHSVLPASTLFSQPAHELISLCLCNIPTSNMECRHSFTGAPTSILCP